VRLSSRPHSHEILPGEDYLPRVFFGLSDDDIETLTDTELIHTRSSRHRGPAAGMPRPSDQSPRNRPAGPGARGSRSVADELAPELRISQAAQTQVATAQALLTRMPCLLAAMEAGELDEHKARQAVDATAPLPDDLAPKVDAIVGTRIGTTYRYLKCE
jgi:hypothetical protein